MARKREYYRVQEAAEYLGISWVQVSRATQSGSLAFSLKGGRKAIMPDALEDFKRKNARKLEKLRAHIETEWYKGRGVDSLADELPDLPLARGAYLPPGFVGQTVYELQKKYGAFGEKRDLPGESPVKAGGWDDKLMAQSLPG